MPRFGHRISSLGTSIEDVNQFRPEQKGGHTKKAFLLFILLFLTACTTGAWWEDMAPSSVDSSVEDGATNVDPATASFSITFVKAVDVSTVTTSTFFLVEVGAQSSISKGAFDSSVCDPSKAISGTVTCVSDTECSFTPSSPLDSGTEYALCLTSDIKYADYGNPYPGLTSTFTTAVAKGEVVPEEEGEEEVVPTDEVAPTITGVTPTANATGVAVNTTVQVVFSEDMDSNGITTTTFTLAAGGVPVTGTVSYNAGTKTATFTPSANLSSFTTYTATVASTVKDDAGNELGNDHIWSFTTSDVIAPSVSSVNPASNATEVALNSAISIVFSEGVDPSTVTTGNITVTGSVTGAITGTVSYDASAKTATFTPSTLLGNLQTYTVIVGTGVKDTSGNALASSYSWSFITKTFSMSRLYQKDGTAAGDAFGTSAAGVGDVNGDGTPDFIVGANYYDPPGKANAGSAYVYSGSDGNELPYSPLIGAAAGDWFGILVAGAGDVNGDGTPDFIVGATKANGGTGSAYVYSGSDGNELPYSPLTGAADNDWFGYSAAGVGDVNSDGRDDFIVGAFNADLGGMLGGARGSVYVYSGANGNELPYSPLTGAVTGDMFGYSVAGAGDVNEDGTPDFIIGAPGYNAWIGRVYVYSGVNGSELYHMDGGAGDDSSLGMYVADAGDLNKDGYDDFIAGAPYADLPGKADAGSAYVYSGANGNELPYSPLTDAAAGDMFGDLVAGAGDVNGDGYDDFTVGADFTDPGVPARADAGSAYVYSGYDGSLLFQIDGDLAGDYFGYPAVGVGDVNGDGKPDIVVGARSADPGGIPGAGSAFIYISE